MERGHLRVADLLPALRPPNVWSVRAFDGGEQLGVVGWVCSCPLDDDEWDDLAEAAAEALADGDAGDDSTISRVTEEPPP